MRFENGLFRERIWSRTTIGLQPANDRRILPESLRRERSFACGQGKVVKHFCTGFPRWVLSWKDYVPLGLLRLPRLLYANNRSCLHRARSFACAHYLGKGCTTFLDWVSQMGYSVKEFETLEPQPTNNERIASAQGRKLCVRLLFTRKL